MTGASLEDALVAGKHYTDQIVGITVDGHQQRDEYYALLYGHLRAFRDVMLPRFYEEYDVLVRETEMIVPFSDDLIYGTRLDLGVRSKATGMAYNVEYKTDSSPSDIMQRMKWHLQMMLESAALSAHLKEEVHGSIVIGIDKGAKRGPTGGDFAMGKSSGERRLSPFTYAYVKDAGTFPEYSFDWKGGKGWRRCIPWVESTPEVWYETMITEMAFDPTTIFVQSTPIEFDPIKYEHVKRQIAFMEARIATGVTHMDTHDYPKWNAAQLDEFFPQNFSNCQNDGGYKRQCPFTDLCHLGGIETNEWLYKERVPNHPLEMTLHRKDPIE